MNKKIIRLTESDLHKIVKESVNRILKEEYVINEAVDEGIGNWLKGAAIGGMMAMSNPQAAQAAQTQGYPQNDSTRVTAQQPQHMTSQQWNRPQMTVKQLKKMFRKAYKDRNANPQVWAQNKKMYVADVNGKTSLVAMIAAAHGENPWNALLKAYCPQESQQADEIFKLSDFGY